MEGVRVVVHAAGLAHVPGASKRQAEQMTRVNTLGTHNVARAALEARVEHFVLVSSVSVYGRGDGSIGEAVECRPEGAYAQSKFLAERAASEVAQCGRLRLTILRLATVYGEGDPGNIGRLMRLIDRGRFVWVGNGYNRKSLLYREDAARACIIAAGTESDGVEIFNVAATPCTMREIVQTLSDALGRKIPRWQVPTTLMLLAARASASIPRGGGVVGEAFRRVDKFLSEDVYDASRFAERFQFSTRIGLREGIYREVEWYRRGGLRPSQT
jgi:nucleoside-diphosphate-sugar epimerase